MRCLELRATGYDGHMSEPSNEDTPDVGLVSDEQLPEDLQPEQNPLARDPGDEREPDADSATAKVEGMPDIGQPGT